MASEALNDLRTVLRWQSLQRLASATTAFHP